MGHFISAWLRYFQQLFWIGWLAIFLVVCAALLSFLLAFFPVGALEWLMGWQPSDTRIAAVAGVTIFPVALGGFVRWIARDRIVRPERPPNWQFWKLGIRPKTD
jgi:hypothetical protein